MPLSSLPSPKRSRFGFAQAGWGRARAPLARGEGSIRHTAEADSQGCVGMKRRSPPGAQERVDLPTRRRLEETHGDSRLPADDAGAARQHPDVGTPDADITPAAEAAGTGAPVLARTAAEIRPATAAEGDSLTFLPHSRLRLAPGQRQEASRHHQSGRAENQQCLAHRGPPSRGSSRPSVPRSLASASIPAPRVPVAGLRIKRVSRPSPLVGEGGAAERSSGVPGEGSQNSTRRFPPHPFRHVTCELRGKITAENPLSPRGKGRGVIGKAWRSRAGAGAPSLRARAPAGRRRHADSRRRDGR
jgi:hypothetical protein